MMTTSLRFGAGRIHFLLESWRPLSSLISPSPAKSFCTTSAVPPETLKDGGDYGNFKRKTARLKSPRRSGKREIGRMPIPKLRTIIQKLCKSKRFAAALEVLTSMETRNNLHMSLADRALRLELTIQLHGLQKAEEYFSQLPNIFLQKASAFPVLRGYVKERNTEKAEAFMLKLKNLGIVVEPDLYNEMMKLYTATSQSEKVPLVIRDMKQNKIMRNVLSYNIWMNACSEIFGVGSVELVYKEMLRDKNVRVGWSTLCTMAKAYIDAGLVEKAFLALEHAEKKLAPVKRLGYFFLITLYTSLNNKDGVLRLWGASKAVPGRITCVNYMCVILCLVKLGDIGEAEKIFEEWESGRRGHYDIRVSNVLLGAYVRNGLLEKAASLHLRTLERGGRPNDKTWEILMEGWLKGQNIDRLIDSVMA